MPTKKPTKATAKKQDLPEKDSTYFLKLVLYLIAGALWLRFPDPIVLGGFELTAFPVGLIVGLLFARHDHFQIDRKIEYAVLLIAAVVSAFINIGIIL